MLRVQYQLDVPASRGPGVIGAGDNVEGNTSVRAGGSGYQAVEDTRNRIRHHWSCLVPQQHRVAGHVLLPLAADSPAMLCAASPAMPCAAAPAGRTRPRAASGDRWPRRVSASVRQGTARRQSAVMPKSAESKTGAAGSSLIARIVKPETLGPRHLLDENGDGKRSALHGTAGPAAALFAGCLLVMEGGAVEGAVDEAVVAEVVGAGDEDGAVVLEAGLAAEFGDAVHAGVDLDRGGNVPADVGQAHLVGAALVGVGGVHDGGPEHDRLPLAHDHGLGLGLIGAPVGVFLELPVVVAVKAPPHAVLGA